jgi:hypothetical protein
VSADQQIPVKPASLCGTHRWLLVSQTGFARSDPWMALEIATQIALFQACTVDDKIWSRLGGDIHRLSEIGCMACAKPDAFGEVVNAASSTTKEGAIGAIKKLGESWIDAAKRKDPSGGES